MPPKRYLACPLVAQMPRRNKRETYEPLDFTPAPRPDGYRRRYESPINTAFTEQRYAEQQRQARMSRGIDWSACLVPGCGRRLAAWVEDADIHKHRRNPEDSLPLCKEHAIIAWQEVQRHRGLPDIIETSEQLAARHHAEAVKLLPRTVGETTDDGELYFVRINDLVKVGWTQTLPRRLKEYGAGAVLLCHYPGTRNDETRLHRRLTAVRAKGREWYHDGDVIQRHVTQALEEHGPPTAKAAWTVPKNPVTVRYAHDLHG